MSDELFKVRSVAFVILVFLAVPIAAQIGPQKSAPAQAREPAADMARHRPPPGCRAPSWSEPGKPAATCPPASRMSA